MPLGDWQFWVVTIIGLIGLWLVIRPFLPKRGGDAACPTCASGKTKKKTRPRRVDLTVERKHVTR